MADIPIAKGAQVLCTLYVGDGKVEFTAKSLKVSANVTKINDGVLGENRDRLDIETNFYDVALSLWGRDMKVLDKVIEEQAVRDAGAQPLAVSFAFAVKPRDGTKKAYSLTEGTVDDWSYDVTGRVDRNMYGVPLRFRYLKSVPI